MSRPGLESGFRSLLDALHRLGISYMIVGSLASSIHGISRATMDVDILADLNEQKIEGLARDLGPDLHADVEQMKDAFLAGRAFNVIHYASSYKFDIFPLAADPFSQSQFARRKSASLPQAGSAEAVQFPVASEEDTILSKLLWYKLGGAASDRQWRDAVGIVRVRGDQLDVAYMKHWAGRLEIAELQLKHPSSRQ